MSDIKNDTDLKPADHVLDEWLAAHGMAVTFDDARQLLASLRGVFAVEITEPTVEEVERVAHVLYSDNEVGAWEDGNLDTLLRYRRTARIALDAYTGRSVRGAV